jgi:hypothetical protein
LLLATFKLWGSKSQKIRKEQSNPLSSKMKRPLIVSKAT